MKQGRHFLTKAPDVARGWESKSVESQQEDRARREAATGPATPEEAARLARRRTLELARARAAADLAAARSPAHRAMLEAALRALDEQLK
jgi:hypothetical protein